MWYSWSSLAGFNTWHNMVCVGLGIPHPNVNSYTGLVDPTAAWTTAYTEVIEVAVNDWRAWVAGDVAATYRDGLGTPSEAPPEPDLAEPFEG
jgi:hypothetical protein